MRSVQLLWPLSILLVFSACVSTKVHRAEISARERCEAREKVLVEEVLDRRKETADLIRQIGELNRLLGSQDAELRDLKLELTDRTQQMGESSSKLATEKSALEIELAAKTAQLEKQKIALESIAAAHRNRMTILAELKSALLKDYPPGSGTALEVTQNAVLFSLPDQFIFDKNGLDISPGGQKLIQPLAVLLAKRPELDVDVLAYTDNILPKGAKGIDDTWTWSLLRATNFVRLLIREFNVNANQLTPVGKGEFYPISSNETAEGRQQNRRTVLAIYPTLPEMPRIE